MLCNAHYVRWKISPPTRMKEQKSTSCKSYKCVIFCFLLKHTLCCATSFVELASVPNLAFHFFSWFTQRQFCTHVTLLEELSRRNGKTQPEASAVKRQSRDVLRALNAPNKGPDSINSSTLITIHSQQLMLPLLVPEFMLHYPWHTHTHNLCTNTHAQ